MQGSGWKQTFFETFTKLFLEAQQLPEKVAMTISFDKTTDERCVD
jgi:hypothetical protein